jgi:AraC-like DNA-binding protein
MPASVLLDGPIRVIDYRCTAERHERPYVETHSRFTLAYVRRGSFGCQARGRSFELVRGSLLVGRHGDEYTCTHDHADGGDECLAFQLDEACVDDVPGALAAWQTGAAPPLAQTMVVGELAQAAATGHASIALDEAALLLAARYAALASNARPPGSQTATPRDRRRAIETCEWIDAHADEPIDLATLAERARLSTYHFLRVFASVVGVTPHQYVVRSRLRRAAVQLAETSDAITDIALDVGFADVSNFVRTFHRAAGVSPREFRRAARGDRKILQDRLRPRAVR